jgi:beta-glucosidase/6-phospho-beta-glucosidase/beta-galactosidase
MVWFPAYWKVGMSAFPRDFRWGVATSAYQTRTPKASYHWYKDLIAQGLSAHTTVR